MRNAVILIALHLLFADLTPQFIKFAVDFIESALRFDLVLSSVHHLTPCGVAALGRILPFDCQSRLVLMPMVTKVAFEALIIAEEFTVQKFSANLAHNDSSLALAAYSDLWLSTLRHNSFLPVVRGIP